MPGQLFHYILPAPQNYGWGFTGSASLAGRMWKNALARNKETLCRPVPDFQEDLPYAELWYGAHPNGVNLILDDTEKGDNATLTTFLKENPSFCGAASDPPLPYLLKILCNDTALSIQCHPDRQRAQELHNRNPTAYPDPNHKPEVSLALRENVEALCGFRPWVQVAEMIRAVPGLTDVLGEDWVSKHHVELHQPESVPKDQQRSLLRDTFRGLMSDNADRAKTTIAALANNATTYRHDSTLPPRVREALQLFERLHQSYPGDVGCFAPFLLNYVVTQPGECLYIKANVLHAYLNGQIVECMACSDNVVRGGLTPKARDMNLLLEILEYDPYEAPFVKPTLMPLSSSSDANAQGPSVRVYDPRVGDFRLFLMHVPEGQAITEPLALTGEASATLVVLQGCGQVRWVVRQRHAALQLTVHGPDGTKETTKPLVQGDALVLAAGSKVTVTAEGSQKASAPALSLSKIICFDDMMTAKRDTDFLAVIATGDRTQ